MIKRIMKTTIITLFLILLCSSVLAYEDELFKFDLPTTYGNVTYQGIYVFADTQNTDNGMMIYVYESSRLKEICLGYRTSKFR